MQYETAKKMGDDKVGFLSPGAIAQTMFEWPLMLKYDAPELAEWKTNEEKDLIHRELLKKARSDVMIYLYNALRFFHEEGKEYIYAPYNFEYEISSSTLYNFHFFHFFEPLYI